MNLMFEPLRKYAVFSGRARRKEYWLFALLAIVANVIITTLSLLAPFLGETFFLVLVLAYLGGFLVPTFAVMVRRLHDLDKSAWWLFLGIVPIANLLLIVWFCSKGTAGENRFGSDPLEE